MDGACNVLGLIEKATDSTAPEVDLRLLKAIKIAVRGSDSELRIAAHTLMRIMKRDHSQVRYLALLIIDELFMRSKLFRAIITVDLHDLLSLTIGLRSHAPLPNPPEVASRLRTKAVQLLEKWNTSYGVYYRQIRLGFHHINTTLRLPFSPDSATSDQRRRRRRQEREVKSKQILLSKFKNLKEHLPVTKKEIQSTVSELEECLRVILSAKNDDEPSPWEKEDGEESANFQSSELRQIRLDSLREGQMVHETCDNKALFDSLKELYKLAVSTHLVSVQDWISVLVRVDLEEEEEEEENLRFRDSALKNLIDVKTRIQVLKKRCEEECGCITLGETEPDGLWEDGHVSRAELSGVIPTAPNRKEEEEEPVKPVKGTESTSTSRSELLSKAPVVKWGSVLDNWESTGDIPANYRGLDIQGHWGRVDHDRLVPADTIAGLNLHAVFYEDGGRNVAETKPCHARLRGGGLCQRKDLDRCPFHGTVVPRGEKGNPVEVSVIGGEGGDGTEERRSEKGKRAWARAHNEAVLREAAEAAWGGLRYGGEGAEAETKKVKKETLASMLRKKKKATARERLSQRLLNDRVGDATVEQLKMAEEVSYREAFLNQW